MMLYQGIGTSYACLGVGNGIEYGKAVALSAATLANAFQALHGSMIEGAGPKPLPPEDLRAKSANAVVFGMIQQCPDFVPPEVRDQARKALQEAQGGAKNMAKPGKSQ